MKAYYFKTILRNFANNCCEIQHFGFYIPSQEVILIKETIDDENTTYNLSRDKNDISKIQQEINSTKRDFNKRQPIIGRYGYEDIKKVDIPEEQVLRLIKNIQLREKTETNISVDLENLVENLSE